MKYVIFENDGEIDVRTIKTFGVSAKNNSNPIGFFGTGMKYAIAILLRNEQEISIFSGEEVYRFKSELEVIREKNFEMIYMNDNPMPFTTHLGTNWQMWQAFRELYCNCLDERGKVYLADEEPSPEKGKTFFVVKGADFEEEFYDKDQIFLNIDRKKILHEGAVDIYWGESRSIYYRGVRVADLPEPSMYTYNVKEHLALTEDRTLQSPFIVFTKIACETTRLKDRGVIRNILTSSKNKFEHKLDYGYMSFGGGKTPTEDFLVVMNEEFQNNNDSLNWSARNWNKQILQQNASKYFERDEMTEVEEKQLSRARLICGKVHDDFSDYPVVIVKTLGQETLALADRNDQKIVVSKACFKLGTKFLVSTLLEEYTHLKTGYSDMTREMQTHLFDTITTMVEHHVIKEPI